MKTADLSKYTTGTIGQVLEASINWKDVREADIHNMARMCVAKGISKLYVNSAWSLPYILEDLEGTDVVPGSFVGTCSGGFSTGMKCFECRHAIDEGAKAIVNAMDLSAIQNNHWGYVEDDIKAMAEAGKDVELTLTVGAPYLSKEQLRKACELAAKYGVDYVLSTPITNFFDGPSISDILTMKEVLEGSGTSIKAGGIKFPYSQNAYTLLRAGADKVIAWEVEELVDDFNLMREVGIVPPYAG